MSRLPGSLVRLVLPLALTLMTGCAAPVGRGGDGTPPPSVPSGGTAEPSPACPAPATPDRPVIIDYVDFVQVGDRQYLRTRTAVPAGKIGRRIATVRCRLEGSGASPDYHAVSGDAAFLPAGTPLFAIRERSPLAAIAVPAGGRYVVYAVATS